jgi:hypothetical protein
MRAYGALSAVGAAALVATVLVVNTGSFSRRSELVEASPQMQQELMGCAKLAKVFKGAKVGASKVTQAQRIEAMRCMQVIKMAHAEKAHAIATRTSGLAQESCNCCAFAGCPCCQPAMESGMQQLSQFKQPPSSKAQSAYGQLPPQSFPFPHSAAPGGMPSSEVYGFKAPVSQLKMKKPFFHREGKFARKTQQLNYAQHGMPSKAQSAYGQLPPQSFPFPHSAAPGGMPSSEEYGFKAPVSQLKMKKPFFHREGKFARKTHKLQKMAVGNKNTMTQPKTLMMGREKMPLGFTF